MINFYPINKFEVNYVGVLYKELISGEIYTYFSSKIPVLKFKSNSYFINTNSKVSSIKWKNKNSQIISKSKVPIIRFKGK